jgi:hypothetical protein
VTSAAVPSPAPSVRPYGLWRAELLKLRKRRGLVVTVGLLTIGIVAVVFLVLAVLHAVNPDHHGPAGGIDGLSGGTSSLLFLGSVAAIIAGSTAGTGDLRAGVLRELVITGRSRVALFGARVPGGLAFLLPFVVATYLVTAVLSASLTDTIHPAPGTGLMVKLGIWALAVVSYWFVIGLGLGAVIGSQGPTIGILIAWRLFAAPLLSAIDFLGGLRDVLPTVAFSNLVPGGLPNDFPESSVDMSSGVAVLVLLLWTALALGIGAWRTSTRDL